MDVINQYLSGNKQELLLQITKLEAVIALAFLICSFVVSGTANAGFNVVLTAILDCGFVAGSYYVLKNSKSPIAVSYIDFSLEFSKIFISIKFRSVF
jgi:hypothetical protein